MLHIKLAKMEQKIQRKHIFCPFTCQDPQTWIKRSFVSKEGHVVYRIKMKEV